MTTKEMSSEPTYEPVKPGEAGWFAYVCFGCERSRQSDRHGAYARNSRPAFVYYCKECVDHAESNHDEVPSADRDQAGARQGERYGWQ